MIAKTVFAMCLFLGLSHLALTQDSTSNSHRHEHIEGCKHDHFHTNELGVSLAPVYYLKAKENPINFGLHAHYVRRLGQTRFGAGLGFEYIFDEHRHQTYSAVFQYSPTYQLHLVAAPGIAIETHHEEDEHEEEEEHHEAAFAIHLEAVYEFEIGPIDIGPSAEFAYDTHDIHLSLGVHIAFPF